jgi:hypothetical protein
MPTAKMCIPLVGADPWVGRVTAWTVLFGVSGTPA